MKQKDWEPWKPTPQDPGWDFPQYNLEDKIVNFLTILKKKKKIDFFIHIKCKTAKFLVFLPWHKLLWIEISNRRRLSKERKVFADLVNKRGDGYVCVKSVDGLVADFEFFLDID